MARLQLMSRRGGLNPAAVLMLALPVLGLMLAGVWVVDRRVERTRIANLERVLVAAGHERPIEVRPALGGCLRAQAGFHWTAGAQRGYACAGPGSRIELLSRR